MYAQLLDHLRLAVAVFMSNDVDAARRLVAEKEQFRDLERISTEKHFARVREGRQSPRSRRAGCISTWCAT